MRGKRTDPHAGALLPEATAPEKYLLFCLTEEEEEKCLAVPPHQHKFTLQYEMRGLYAFKECNAMIVDLDLPKVQLSSTIQRFNGLKRLNFLATHRLNGFLRQPVTSWGRTSPVNAINWRKNSRRTR